MTEPLVSLVMPVWRPRPDWLWQAVASALSQRGCSIELIAVDDGCPEPISELLSSFEDSRLRVLRVDHRGAARARNAGIADAKGSLMRFIDADDTIELDSTARLATLIDGRDDVIAYGATMFCDENLRPLWKMTSKVEGDGVRACLLGRFTTRPHAFLFPRRVVEATGDWDTEIRVTHDWDFILRALEHASVRGTTAVVTYYRRHPGGVTLMTAEGLRGPEQVVNRYFERHPEERGTSLERKARARALALVGRVYATNRRPGKALAALGRAAGRDPAAVWVELAQGLPAAAAYGHRLLGMRPRGLPEGSPAAGA
jgi:glycosyltransferase involved in cell wall biosynthesis